MRPKRGLKMAAVNIYALPYQPMSSMEWNSSVMLGIAVAMIIRSKATRKIDMYMLMMIIQNLGDLGLKFFSASAYSSSSSKGPVAPDARMVPNLRKTLNEIA